jgi:Ca2+-binding EF-hand superfamily protein
MDKKSAQTRTKNQKASMLTSEVDEYIQRSIKTHHILLRQFHDNLCPEKISQFWDLFRYSENRNNGNIAFDNFGQIMQRVFPQKFADLLDVIYYRFATNGSDIINIYDLLISFSVFMKRDQKTKLNVLMKLMDVDEDNCLSILELKNLVFKLEELFIMFQHNCRTSSRSELNIISKSLANEKFNYLTNYKYQHEKDLKALSQILMPYDELFEILETKKSFYNDFLPSSVFFEDFLQFRYKEVVLANMTKEFVKFSNEIGRRVQTKVYKNFLSSMMSTCTSNLLNQQATKKDLFASTVEQDMRASSLLGDKRVAPTKALALPMIKNAKAKMSLAFNKRSFPVKKEIEESMGNRSKLFEERRKMVKVLKIAIQLPNHIPVSKIINGL